MRPARPRILAASGLGILVACSIALAGCSADPRLAAADEVMADLLADDLPGCVAAAAVEGDVVWTGARGLADVDGGIPLTESTRFNIGSVSKQLTSLALLMLAESGEVQLDAPVSEYLDGLPAWADPVTVRDLMNHTAGILDPVFPPGTRVTREMILEGLRTDPTTHVDSDSFTYSNAGYVLLAMIVEAVTGEDFDEWLADNVFEPTGTDMRLERAEMEPDEALGYASQAEPFDPLEDGSIVFGPTAIVSTMNELAKWGEQYRTRRLIDEATWTEALAEAATFEGDEAVYAAGIFHADANYWHEGSDDGIGTLFLTDTATGTTLALACNSPIEQEFADRLLGIWVPEVVEPPTPTPTG